MVCVLLVMKTVQHTHSLPSNCIIYFDFIFKAPTLTGLDITTTASVSDGVQAAEITLASLTVTDANDVTAVPIACTIQAPNTALFQLTGAPPSN
jgi:hypothetical protein